MANRRIFVFGSNLAGVHGAGAARAAYEHHGALWGQGYGASGHSFAIPTKDNNIRTMRLEDIKDYVEGFLSEAAFNHHKEYQVTRIGCGLAGLRDEDMAIMFKGATSNVLFDHAWEKILGTSYNYWGTF